MPSNNTAQSFMGSQGIVGIMSRRASNLKKLGELKRASEENPGARTEARKNGIAIGAYIRYLTNGVEHYGVVRSLGINSIVVELSAAGLMKGGEDIIVREDEIPYAGVQEILGEGRLAQPKPTEKAPLPMAPPRDKFYLHCDFDGAAIFEVVRTKTGLIALCKNHAKGPTNDEPLSFKFKLGLLIESWSAWPKPTEQELAALASQPSPSRGSSSNRASGKSSQSPGGKGTRKRRTS